MAVVASFLLFILNISMFYRSIPSTLDRTEADEELATLPHDAEALTISFL